MDTETQNQNANWHPVESGDFAFKMQGNLLTK